MDPQPPSYDETVQLTSQENENQGEKQGLPNTPGYPNGPPTGYHLQQPNMYQPGQPAGHPYSNPSSQVVHQFQPVVAVAPPPLPVWGPEPYTAGNIICFRCRNHCNTYTRETFKQAAYVWCLVIFCFSSLLLAWVPFVMKDMKEITHYCSFCHQKLGVCLREVKTGSKAILITIVVVGFVLSMVFAYYMFQKTLSLYTSLNADEYGGY